jgi:hypothetical protein
MLCGHHYEVHERYLFQCVAVLFQATHLLPPPPCPGTRKPHSFLGVLKRSEHNACIVIQCRRAAIKRLEEIDASPMYIFAVVIQIG